MNCRILKYELQVIDDIQRIDITDFNRVLSVIEQNGSIIVYVEVGNPGYTNARSTKFRVVGTNGEYPQEPNLFIGTVKVEQFVWHVFQIH